MLLLPGAARKFDVKMDVGRLYVSHITGIFCIKGVEFANCRRQNGEYVQIVRSKFNESHLTSKVYHEVSLMRLVCV